MENRISKVIVFKKNHNLPLDDMLFNVVQGDWLQVVKKIHDESIDLIFTSPPYNLGKNYKSMDDDRPLKEYLRWHKRVLKSCYRILRNGGRMAWQVGSIIDDDGEYFPLHQWVAKTCMDIGFIMRGEIIWDKQQITKRTAWGSWMSASDNKILPGFEYIELFCKGNKKIQHRRGEDTVNRNNFIDWTNAMWRIAPETELHKEHPAPFPVELARRVIEMNSYTNAIVLDPFSGLGTTALAAKRLGRIPVAVEAESEFVNKAVRRLNSEMYYDWGEGSREEDLKRKKMI